MTSAQGTCGGAVTRDPQPQTHPPHCPSSAPMSRHRHPARCSVSPRGGVVTAVFGERTPQPLGPCGGWSGKDPPPTKEELPWCRPAARSTLVGSGGDGPVGAPTPLPHPLLKDQLCR